ncbi:uncharacterized protein FIBRA_04735 [Fibroporia radiculosa]|uniref:MADS-box domain-containing protein n=1 Tax=Fibroporia radiculosa TaxID=599839 RepID=J4IAB7_9APHY|nr:uncharacterized protein FIBRA_04735 [Fibroporia radiculosa]CCM02631.1 predicted protein [Fibroporia radiculosa]
MGRRKIEIQPITRKNGLFKKAYELGVLCSVDVAVIIFEERPGHHVKLYQYCSTDVHSMVQRHIRFDGEKDTRTPHDFSNNKTEEAADDDDDADDDDTNRVPKARRDSIPSKQGKIKTESTSGSIRPAPQSSNDASMSIDLESYRAVRSPSNNPATALPISGERHGASAPSSTPRGPTVAAKRPRLADDPHPVHSIPAIPQSLNIAALGANPPSYPYRLEVDMSQYPVQSHITPLSSIPPSHSVAHPSLQSTIYSGSGGSMPSLLTHQSAPPGFLPQVSHSPFDLSHQTHHPHHPSLRTVPFQSHSSSPYASQQQSLPLQSVYIPHRAPPQQVQNTGAAGMAVELLGDQGSGHPSQQFQPFDWPVHSQHPQQGDGNSSQNNPDGNWFDFLSGGPSQNNPGPGASLFPTHTRPASNSISSTRSMASYALPPSHSSSASPALGQKRPREEEPAPGVGVGPGVPGVDFGDVRGRGRSADRAPGIAEVRRGVSVDKVAT